MDGYNLLAVIFGPKSPKMNQKPPKMGSKSLDFGVFATRFLGGRRTDPDKIYTVPREQKLPVESGRKICLDHEVKRFSRKTPFAGWRRFWTFCLASFVRFGDFLKICTFHRPIRPSLLELVSSPTVPHLIFPTERVTTLEIGLELFYNRATTRAKFRTLPQIPSQSLSGQIVWSDALDFSTPVRDLKTGNSLEYSFTAQNRSRDFNPLQASN